MRYYSCDELIKDAKMLCQMIDEPFDAILAVARGGLTLAHLLAECLEIRDVFTVTSQGYEGYKKLSCIQLGTLPDLGKRKNILIVDDIIDSGDTIAHLLKTIKECYPKKNFKVASLFFKKDASVQPDFSIHEAKEWIDFFWTRDMHDFNDR
ncbi:MULTISPECIES: phosphoribosyltransferase [unclassified Nitratiruptor]|uniref:phosphoribosyltransferase n=1 Tax=unclassified Nitratiruptor TaxID=2624044 RepID=UPI001916BC60|nr:MULTISPECIES: phosphoribosyltransferase family protein [unclassified Nitratiruptor]BCD59949.1 xanthine phosphoribosyltransferase [Nitratiruptor sp. YY08-10]BCD63872.1 xanthine phosphoribosyltransferase [Nitratiruptor sp. YY08-14]